MASNLRKYKCTGATSNRPSTSSHSGTELKNTLKEDFENIKAEMQAVKTEITGCMVTMCAEIHEVRGAVKEVESGLSTWSDDYLTGYSI